MSPYRSWPFLSDGAHPLLSALWAVAAHGVLALFVLAPIVRRSRHPLGYAALAFVGGSLIDVDHLIAAGSFSLHALENLGDRPATHSLVFVALLGMLVLGLTRRPRVAWAVFAVNASHLLWDAAGGRDRIFYPLSGLDGLPWLACPLGALALLAGSVWIARRTAAAAERHAPGEPAGTLVDLG